MSKFNWGFLSNDTDYSTVQVRSIMLRAARQTCSGSYPIVVVRILPARKDSVTMKASTSGKGSGIIYLRLPADPQKVDKALIACLTSWACGLFRGIRQRDMTDDRAYDPRKDYAKAYPWAEDMPLTKKQPKAKPTGAALALKKAEKAQDMVNKWEAKLKRTTTMLKKWRKKLRYYERRGEQLQSEWAKRVQDAAPEGE